MPVEYSKVTHEDVRRFLRDAAGDPDVRKSLVTQQPAGLKKLLRGYNIEFGPREKLPSPPRKIPTRAECEQLIAIFGLDDEFAEAMYSRASSSLAPLIMVIGHAMPLVATVDSEVAAAG
jgi:hypothetical protein